MPSQVASTGIHDVGGSLADISPLDLEKDEKVYKYWERQVHGMVTLLVKKGLLSLDELRRGVEGLPGYEQLTYYERWVASMSAIQLERGTITQAELDAALGPLPQEEPVRHAAGDIVRVKAENSTIRVRKPHLRTPGYIFDLVGTIERECVGAFNDPEREAFRIPAPRQPLYRVRFSLADVWEGAGGAAAAPGGRDDTVDIEIYQSWLEPATALELAAQREAREARQRVGGMPPTSGHEPVEPAHHGNHGHERLKPTREAEGSREGKAHSKIPRRDGQDLRGSHGSTHGHASHSHDHAHPHDHRHDDRGHSHRGVIDHGDHTHEARAEVEQRAVDLEGGAEDAERRLRADAFTKVMIDKGIVTLEELRAAVEVMDTRGYRGEGPRVVARAWVDPEFRARLFQDTSTACAELGIVTSNFSPPAKEAGSEDPPAASTPGVKAVPRSGTILTALENTPTVHNLIVCTLCSCYPLTVLGMSPPWYKSRSYRARAVRDPRGVLAEFGTLLPSNVAVRVHDSTADLRYMVIPTRPAGTEGWSEERLRLLVTRDSMIGVTHAKTPEQLEREEAEAAATEKALAPVPL